MTPSFVSSNYFNELGASAMKDAALIPLAKMPQDQPCCLKLSSPAEKVRQRSIIVGKRSISLEARHRDR